MGSSSRGAWYGGLIAFGVLAAVPVLATPPSPAPSQGEAIVPGIAELGVVMKRAEARDKAGDYRRAERDWREALARRIALLGPRDPAVATGMGYLAANLEKQGRWREAEALRRDAVALLEAAPGATRSALGMTQSLLALNLTRQGRTGEAATMAYAALATWRKDGEDTLDAAWGFNGVGAALVAQEKFADAEPFYRRALEIRRRRLGDADPDTATSANNLGTLLLRMGRTDEALALLRHALAAREGADSVGAMTAQSAFNLGVALDGGVRPGDATVYLEKALAIWRALGGADGIDAAAAYNALGMNACHLGDYRKSEALLRRALAIRLRVLGDEHGDTGESYANMAVNLAAMERYREALALHDKGLAIRVAAFGRQSLPVADSLSNRAASLRAVGRDGAARDDAVAAYTIYRSTLGEGHRRTMAMRDLIVALRADEAAARDSRPSRVDMLRKGGDYVAARSALLAAGWRPDLSADCPAHVVGAETPAGANAACDRLPELTGWSRTGRMTAAFRGADGGTLVVLAQGDLRRWLSGAGKEGPVVTGWSVSPVMHVPTPVRPGT